MTNTNNNRNLGAILLNTLVAELTKAGLAEEYGLAPVPTQEEVIAPVEQGVAIPEVPETLVEQPATEQPATTEQGVAIPEVPEAPVQVPTEEPTTTEQPEEATSESAGAWGIENFYYNCNGIEIELGSLVVTASPEVIAKLKAILTDPKAMLNPIVEKFVDAEMAAQQDQNDFTEVPPEVPEAPADEQSQTSAPEVPEQEEQQQTEAPETPKQEEEPKADNGKEKKHGKNKK